MSKPVFMGLVVVAAALAVAASSQAATASGDQAKASRAIVATLKAQQQQAVQLSPIVVVGHHRVPLPIALQIIKKGLSLPWTNDLNDTRLRCRVTEHTGSHLPGFWCETNRRHIMRVEKLHTAFATSFAAGGGFPTVNAMFQKDVNVSALLGLLHKMPPANASYTLRVTGDDGKPVLDYVVKNGELAHIYHYVYKNGKVEKH